MTTANVKDRYDKLIDRIKEDAARYGFTEDELSTSFLDGLFGRGKATRSTRIFRLMKLTYYRGWMRGVKMVKEAHTPITLRGGVIEEEATEQPRYPVITLCGSTKFKHEYEAAMRLLTKAGNVVISVGLFGHADGVTLTEEEKAELDRIHLQKIDMADEIFVINVGGYIGSSTRNEIAYATKHQKRIMYLEPIEA